MEEEIWKNVNIKGFEHYKVSNLGNVKNNKNKILKLDNNDGYLRINLRNYKNDIKSLNIRVHRLVAITFIENSYKDKTFDQLVVNHKNFIRSDNRVENLEWCTQKENSNHYCSNNIFKNPITITINNIMVEYISPTKASEELDLTKSIIYYRLNSNNYPNYNYKYSQKEKNINNSIKEDGVNIKKVYGFDKYLITKDGKVYSTYNENIILLSYKNKNGYKKIKLYKNKKQYDECIHRLVLKTFDPCENMEKYVVNHKNLNRSDNRLENLEWCTQKENTIHAFNNKIIHHKSVIKYDINKNKLKEYKSIIEASIDTFNNTKKRKLITDVCNYKRISVGIYRFTFKENENIFKDIVKKTTSKIIIKYDTNNNFIKEYSNAKYISQEIYNNYKKYYINKIHKICRENTEKNDNFIILDGYILKYKIEPKKYILKYNIEGTFLKMYPNLKETSIDTFGKHDKNICNYILLVCNGKRQSTNNYIFKFVEENSEEYNKYIK